MVLSYLPLRPTWMWGVWKMQEQFFNRPHMDVGSADIVYVQEVRYQGNAGAITEEQISA